MKKATVVAGIAVVLLSGIVIGAIGHVQYTHYRMSRLPRIGPPGMRVRALERMASTLGLDDKQKAAIDAVLAQSYKEAALLYEKQRPELDQLTDSVLARMRVGLTPAQQNSLQAAWEDFQKRRRRPEPPKTAATREKVQP